MRDGQLVPHDDQALNRLAEPTPPPSRPGEVWQADITQTAPATASGQVWVNTKSGVIWKPGSRYYGKTKEGKYMAADAALQAGYHYAGGTGN